MNLFKNGRKIEIIQVSDFSDYFVSKKGDVYSCKNQRFKKLKNRFTNGYICVSLCKDGKVYSKYVHRLVLETFVGPCPDGLECCHKDGNKSNNDLSNLY